MEPTDRSDLLRESALLDIPAAAASPAANNSPRVSAPVVLVVDDEPSVRSVVVRTLAAEGYGVLDASDGIEALEIVERTPHIDLVVTDVAMPRMGGTALAERLAQRCPELPVLFISGWIDEDEARRIGRRLLAKPFSPDALVEVVSGILAQRFAAVA